MTAKAKATKKRPAKRKRPAKVAKFIEVYETAKADPGEWYVLGEYAKRNGAASARLRLKKVGVVLPESTKTSDFEVVAQGEVASDTSTLYVRYTGKG